MACKTPLAIAYRGQAIRNALVMADAQSMKHPFGHDHGNRRRGIAIGLAHQRSARSSRLRKHPRHFVTQTHALGLPRARPGSLLIIGLVAVVLYVIGRRLSRQAP